MQSKILFKWTHQSYAPTTIQFLSIAVTDFIVQICVSQRDSPCTHHTSARIVIVPGQDQIVQRYSKTRSEQNHPSTHLTNKPSAIVFEFQSSNSRIQNRSSEPKERQILRTQRIYASDTLLQFLEHVGFKVVSSNNSELFERAQYADISMTHQSRLKRNFSDVLEALE